MYNSHQIDIGTASGNTLSVLLRKLFNLLQHYRLVPPLKGIPTISITPVYFTMAHDRSSRMLDRYLVNIKCPLEGGRTISIIHTVFKANMSDHVSVTVEISDNTTFRWDNSCTYGISYLIAMLDVTWVPFLYNYRKLRVECAVRSVQTALLVYLKECYNSKTIPELSQINHLPLVYI